MFRYTLVATVSAIALSAVSATGATLTSNTLTNASVYDFSEGPSVLTGGPEVRSIGDISFTFTSENNRSVFDYTNGYGLGLNGRWTSGRDGYAGTNSRTAAMSFTFSEGVSGVGGLFNYAPTYGQAILRIFDGSDALIEEFNLTSAAPIATSRASNVGGFRGFDLGENVIHRFEVSGAYAVIDDLTISQVPLPAGLPMLLIGLGGFAMMRRRQAA